MIEADTNESKLGRRLVAAQTSTSVWETTDFSNRRVAALEELPTDREDLNHAYSCKRSEKFAPTWPVQIQVV